jgi:hypothetical protein
LEDPIVSQVMESLEVVDGALISQDQVMEALKEVAKENKTSVDKGDLSSIMMRLFDEADQRSNRMVRRQDLRKVLSKYRNGLQSLK